MSELSPAAQAVLDAWENKLLPDVTCLTHDPEREALAAALRAAADQVVPEEKTEGKMFPWQHERLEQRLITRDCILAIVAELEGAQ